MNLPLDRPTATGIRSRVNLRHSETLQPGEYPIWPNRSGTDKTTWERTKLRCPCNRRFLKICTSHKIAGRVSTTTEEQPQIDGRTGLRTQGAIIEKLPRGRRLVLCTSCKMRFTVTLQQLREGSFVPKAFQVAAIPPSEAQP